MKRAIKINAKTYALPKFITHYMLVYRNGKKWVTSGKLRLEYNIAVADRYGYPISDPNSYRIVEIKLPE